MPTIKPKFIIQYIDNNYEYYVAKGSFVLGGEKYRCITDIPTKAQTYSSYNKAKQVAEQLLLTCVNVTNQYNIIKINKNTLRKVNNYESISKRKNN